MIQSKTGGIYQRNPKLEIAVLRLIEEDVYKNNADKIELNMDNHNKVLVNDDLQNMSMLVKDTRSQDGIDDKDNDKGSKSRSQSMKEQTYNKEQRKRPRPHELKRMEFLHCWILSWCGVPIEHERALPTNSCSLLSTLLLFLLLDCDLLFLLGH
ncbi:hypothetical protein Tco_0046477 [Tanacetum coccineum]